MKNESYNLPHLIENCSRIRRDILLLSGMTEDDLYQASIELDLNYGTWCSSKFKGPGLADCFMGFSEMLRQEKSPWPHIDGSSLNGLTVAQFYFVWAYFEIQIAIGLLAGTTTLSGATRDESLDEAAVDALSAAKALMHAKHLLGSSSNCLAQASC